MKKLVEGMGGTVESFDFSLGGDDAYLIVEVPEITAVAACSLVVAAAGGARLPTVPLLTPAQMDEAARMDVVDRAPGA